MKALLTLIAILNSLNALADDFDPSAIHDPGIADGCVVIDLPRSSSVGRNNGPDNFSSYYIEQVSLDRKFDDKEVTHGIRVTNTGTSVLGNLVITDIFPVHSNLKNAQPLPSVFRPDSVSWMIGRLEANQSYFISITFNIKGCDKLYDGGVDVGHLVVNTACVWNPFVRLQTCAWLPAPFDKDIAVPPPHGDVIPGAS